MARPVRTKKLQTKFSEDEYILDGSLKRTSAKKSEIVDEKRTSKNRGQVAVENVEGLQKRSLRGKLDNDPRPLKRLQIPVLRDRTNLNEERLKVDLLMKQGTRGEITKKTQSALKAASSEDKDKAALKMTEIASKMRIKSQRGRKDPSPTVKDQGTERLKSLRLKNIKNSKDELESKLENVKKTSKISVKRDLKNTKKQDSDETMRMMSEKHVVEKESSDEEESNDCEMEQFQSSKRTSRKNSKSDSTNNDKKEIESTTSKIRKNLRVSKVDKKLPEDLKEEAPKEQENSKRSSRSAVKRESLRKNEKRLSKVSEEGEGKNKSDSKTTKKFFKNTNLKERSQVLSVKNIVPIMRKKGRQLRLSVTYKLKQPTLQESFAMQKSRAVLRPRKVKENDLAKKDTNDENAEEKRTGPIYKSVKLQETSTKDKDEIYEFRFDSNDSREKFQKKKKRVVRKNTGTRTKSNVKKGVNSKTAIKKSNVRETKKEKKMDEDEKALEPIQPIEEESHAPPNEIMEIDEAPVITETPQKTKIKIVESVTLAPNERINLTATPVLAKSSESRTRNLSRPSNQFRKMLSHDLLTKSISPINRAIENFDPGSPWRPPVLTTQTFSRIKNIVQSTPQIKEFGAKTVNSPSTSAVLSAQVDTKSNKAIDNKEKQVKTPEKLTKENVEKSPSKILEKSRTKISKASPVEMSKDSLDEIENYSPAEVTEKVLVQAAGVSKSPRKFGTEISNVNPSGLYPMVIDLNKDNSTVNSSIAIESRMATMSEPMEALPDFDDDFSDKENQIMNLSPNKSPLKAVNRTPMKTKVVSKMRSPVKSPKKRVFTTLRKMDFEINKENSGPRAGPSTAKNSVPLESRILRQSNLNNFLNLDEMPKSATISTKHEIFGDAHSTPISAKFTKTESKVDSIQNAFGFDESSGVRNETSTEVSPIPKPSANKIQEKVKKAAPARFSIGEIKEVILRDKTDSNEKPIIENTEKEQQEENQPVESGNEKVPETDSFSDTFDLFADDIPKEHELKEIPLFAELEPVRFKEAPKYSYKRKRPVRFLSDDDESADHSFEEARQVKKRKKSKLEIEREKRVENWAKNLNQTFEEIDNFDLVVE